MRSGMLLLLHDPRRNQVAPIFFLLLVSLIQISIFLNLYISNLYLNYKKNTKMFLNVKKVRFFTKKLLSLNALKGVSNLEFSL